MPPLLDSAWSFVRQTVWRAGSAVTGVIFAGLEAAERATDKKFPLPTWAKWSVLSAGLLYGSIRTYHEARMTQRVIVPVPARDPADARAAMLVLLDQQTGMGNDLANSCLNPQITTDDVPRLAQDVAAWVQETREIIRAGAPEYENEFMRNGPGQRLPKNVVREAGRLWLVINERLQRVAEIRHDLR